MIIFEDNGGEADEIISSNNDSQFQTADELNEVTSLTNKLRPDEELLNEIDIGLLYQNTDFGTQLISNKLNCQVKKSNQLLEKVIHQDDDHSDDDVYIKEKLCHKCGCINIDRSEITTEYNKYFKFNDLCSFELESRNSLIDNMCHKRMEDNYNFDLDNIILYVNNTLEQLKSISNGDYLTNKAREKWLETTEDEKKNVLTTSTSIPLHIERKRTRDKPKWDEMVHSEVDIRSLCKILEKKVVFEIPKLIKSPYKVFSKSGDEGMVLRCQKKNLKLQNSGDVLCPRVDVVFQIKKSDSGHILSNISSIMILKNTLTPLARAKQSTSLIKYEGNNETFKYNTQNSKIVLDQILNTNDDIHTGQENNVAQEFIKEDKPIKVEDNTDKILVNIDSVLLSQDDDDKNYISESGVSSDWTHYPDTAARTMSNESVKLLKTTEIDMYPSELEDEAASEIAKPDDLMLTIQKLSKQSTVLEENEEMPKKESLKCVRKRSPLSRIKSPYANKSHAIEEKKRKRLLEIREKRERRKMALLETCKGKKNKLPTDGIQPQASTSVTKLSISNKSFYNSIFGKSADTFKKNRKGENNDQSKKSVETEMQPIECEPVLSIMSFNIQCDDTNIPSVIPKSTYEVVDSDIKEKNQLLSRSVLSKLESEDHKPEITYYKANIVPDNTPRKTEKHHEKTTKQTSNDVKQSIGKIYDLMNSLSAQGDTNVGKHVVNNFIPDSDSGTSIKHCDVISSNPSSNSFEKPYTDRPKIKNDKKYSPTIPKVVISSKLQTLRQAISEKTKLIDNKNDRSSNSNQNNPLKAITQILHEFENVQKTKKNIDDNKYKYNRRMRQESSGPRSPTSTSLNKSNKMEMTKENKNKPTSSLLTSKFDSINVKHIDNGNVKFSDISDEAKEARGEAVKGPSRPNTSTRIHALAQPKRAYVQAHSEEFQHKYGRNLIADRLQRLASNGYNQQEPNSPGRQAKVRAKKGNDLVNPTPLKEIDKPLDRKRLLMSRGRAPVTPSMPAQFVGNRNAVTSVKVMDFRNPKKTNQTIDMIDYSRPHSPIKCSIIKKSRFPIVPNDLELGNDRRSDAPSAKCTKEDGIEAKLHNIINKINNKNLTDVPEYIEEMDSGYYAEDDNFATAVIENKLINLSDTSGEKKSKTDEERSQACVSTQMSLLGLDTKAKLSIQKHVSFNTDIDPITPLLCQLRSLSSSKLKSDPNAEWFPLKITTVGYSFSNGQRIRPHTAPKVSVNKFIKDTEGVKEQALQTNCHDDELLKMSCSSECCQTEQMPITDIFTNTIEKESEPNLITNIENTNSLDILVKLLNEIQNITTKQTQITKNESNYENDEEKAYKPIAFCKDSLSATALDYWKKSSTRVVSVTKLREFYEPKKRKISRNVSCRIAPIISDKEILTEPQYLKVDGSSQVFNSTSNHSTNTNPIIISENLDKLQLVDDKCKHIEDDHIPEIDDEFIIKIKRDVLVTVYSILVVTVFAALSFPDFYINTFH